MATSRNGTEVEDLNMLSVRVVHGFAVTGFVFTPLTTRLQRQSLDAKLFRYPSVGFSLNEIIDRVAKNLIDDPPGGIIAHSLGCVATLEAIHRISWAGPIVLLAPPIKTLPLTRFIPRLMRWPFAPLIDHREWTSADGQSLSAPPQCPTMTIVGRVDMIVPRSCTHLNGTHQSHTLWHSHNSMLLSSAVVNLCVQWIKSDPRLHASKRSSGPQRPPFKHVGGSESVS